MCFFTFCNYLLQFQVCLIILIAGHTSGYYGGYAGIDGSRDDVSDPEREENGFIDNLDRVYQYQRFRHFFHSVRYVAYKNRGRTGILITCGKELGRGGAHSINMVHNVAYDGRGEDRY